MAPHDAETRKMVRDVAYVYVTYALWRDQVCQGGLPVPGHACARRLHRSCISIGELWLFGVHTSSNELLSEL